MSEKVFGTKKQGSIKDIPLPENNSQGGNTLDLGGPRDPQGPRKGGGMQDWSGAKRKNKRFGFKLGIASALVLLVGVLYSFMFHSATITVVEKTQNAVIPSQEFTAYLTAPVESDLEFIRVEPFTKTESIYVEGSVEENRQTKSSGMLTVYNTDSTEKNYIKNTRFKTEDGLVYRAFNRFTIPSGSEENPGTTEVLVVAENPGQKYNSEEGLSFTLPALKEQGDPSYEFVYAEQAEPLVGGYSGIVSVPLEEDITEAEVKLRTRLEDGLYAEFAETLPDNYVIRSEFTRVEEPEYTQEPNEEKGGVTLVGRTRMYAVVFTQEAFDQHLAQQVLDEVENIDALTLSNREDLTFEMVNDDFNPRSDDEFGFEVTGEAEFTWAVNTKEVQNAAAGKLKSHIMNNLVTDLSSTPVESVDITPMWRRSLPEDIDSIEVIVK